MFSFLVFLLLIKLSFGDFVSNDYDEYNKGKLGHSPHIYHYSSPEYSPVLQVNIWNESAISQTGSHIFLKHDGNSSQTLSSPLILDANDLSAVYLNRSFENVFGTRVQENFGKKYLTFWEGKKGDGVGDGYGLAFDENYRLTYKVWARNIAVHSDLHEFALTGNGTALVTGVDKVKADTSTWKGWRGTKHFPILDSLFQEIDLETNEVLFSWRALDHISPMDSFEPKAYNWDVYHMNSIQKTQAGNYLISIRHIHSILLIDGKTGDIIWTLGGKRNDFVELAPAEEASHITPLLTMSWQHHARYVPGSNETQMTFFDNHGKVTTHGKCTSDCSRGLHIDIDDSVWPPTARLKRGYFHPKKLQAQSQGSLQPLTPNANDLGNVFIGWGRCPSFTEHTSTGETIMDVQISPWHSTEVPDALDNYRAYKQDWVGNPWWDPSIALKQNEQDNQFVFASWNGATEVREWAVRGVNYTSETGEFEDGIQLARTLRTGFETRLLLGAGTSEYRYLWAEALDKDGNVLRTSDVLDSATVNITTISMTATDEEILEAEANMDSNDADESDSLISYLTWILLGLGFVVGIVIIAGIVWYQRREYAQLDGEDFGESDTELDDELEFDVSYGLVLDPENEKEAFIGEREIGEVKNRSDESLPMYRPHSP